ncbi:indole-3-glycerol phosphate synthase TrpC [Bacillus cereus]|uniref:indole-3-glycerol phosphate synthase TrpC n=1 Tax=Bacillus TaxID=1386 RepID=UPI0005550755|nr:indole-3-glycerol phosphate synthase TrpC [Bacillus sp. UNC322MFChir4.1]
MNILDQIIKYKIPEVENKKKNIPKEVLIERIKNVRETRNFYEAIGKENMSLIAEVKHKSPSKGVLREEFEPVKLARAYERSGARAISVIVDEKSFGGSVENLRLIATDPQISLPVMYKEFIVDEYQIYEARANGADAVLIIVRAVDKPNLIKLINTAHQLEMEVLTETFTLEEVELSIEAGARIIGINNRDLQTFKVDLNKSKAMKNAIPSNYLTVSESGIKNQSDVILAQEMGFDGMLVGEAILQSTNIEKKIKELINVK